MQLLHPKGNVHTQPATRNAKQMFFSPHPPLKREVWHKFQISDLRPN